ncbi:unnamed protein product [Symbiodinium sp. CCMP2592]|nr:unnamed protein product [Symbiodinium sp. CCMP2592]
MAALFADAASVAGDSIDEDWKQFQLPELGQEEVDESPQVPQASGKRGRKGGGKGKADSGRGQKGQGKGKLGVIKKQLKGPIKCKGCKKKIPPEQQAPNFPGCWVCKRALDNVWKCACRQGEQAMSFVQECRRDDEACCRLVQSYLKACPEKNATDGSCAGKRRGKWSIVKYMESVRCSSGLVKDCIGEFMSKMLYQEHALTARGGRKSAAEIEAQWENLALETALKWEKDIEKGAMQNTLYDYKGPAGSLRVWVATKDTLSFRSEYLHTKEVVCEGDSVKKGGDEDVDRLRSEIMSGHGQGVGAGMEQAAKAMALNGQEAFQEGSTGFLNVLDLQNDVFMLEAGEDDGEAGQNPTTTDEPSPKKPKLWIDRDRIVSQTIRTVKSQHETFETKAMAQLNRQQAYLKTFLSEHEAESKGDFKGEYETLKTRTHGLELCLRNKDEEKIKQFIGLFGHADSPAPPCEDYDKLRPLCVFPAMIEDYNKCTEQEHLKDVSAALAAVREPISQLLAGALRAEKSLKTALTQQQKVAAQKHAKAQKALAANTSQGLAIFDQGVANASAIPVFKADALGQGDNVPDLSKPFLVHIDEWVAEINQESSVTRQKVDAFKVMFDTLRAQAKGGRASKLMKELLSDKEAEVDFEAKVNALLKNVSGLVKTSKLSKPIQDVMAVSVFGMDQGYDKVSCESASMACVRFNVSGTRSVVVAHTLEVIGYMQRKGVTGSISVARMASFFRSLSATTISDFQAQCTLQQATVGAGDVLYLPAGAVLAELARACNIGLRVPLVVNATAHPNVAMTFARRRDEIALQEASSQFTESQKQVLKQEHALLDSLIKTVAEAENPEPEPAAAAVEKSEAKEGGSETPAPAVEPAQNDQVKA